TADEALVARGKTHFQTMCVACHGATGQGMQALGAPNLTDDTWLYGGDPDTLATTIANGRNGSMPAHGALLSDDEITLLTAYVLSLSDRDVGGSANGMTEGGR
ncbi:MAG: c-type cytochrome, partial [Pseudomonadota bacterium]